MHSPRRRATDEGSCGHADDQDGPDAFRNRVQSRNDEHRISALLEDTVASRTSEQTRCGARERVEIDAGNPVAASPFMKQSTFAPRSCQSTRKLACGENVLAEKGLSGSLSGLINTTRGCPGPELARNDKDLACVFSLCYATRSGSRAAEGVARPLWNGRNGPRG